MLYRNLFVTLHKQIINKTKTMENKEFNLKEYQKNVVLTRKGTGITYDLAHIRNLTTKVSKLLKEDKKDEAKSVLSEIFACIAYTCYDIDSNSDIREIIDIYAQKAYDLVNKR